jgi:hypothetical protein
MSFNLNWRINFFLARKLNLFLRSANSLICTCAVDEQTSLLKTNYKVYFDWTPKHAHESLFQTITSFFFIFHCLFLAEFINFSQFSEMFSTNFKNCVRHVLIVSNMINQSEVAFYVCFVRILTVRLYYLALEKFGSVIVPFYGFLSIPIR